MRHAILTLPIHRRSREAYYREHDRWAEAQKPELEKRWHRPYDEIPAHIRLHWKDRWYWPPWYLNDVAGYLRLGTDEDRAMVGDVYLKRRHFKVTAPERVNHDQEPPGHLEQFLLLGSTAAVPVEAGENGSYVEAVGKIIREAHSMLRTLGRGTRTSRVTLPDYDLACLDFAAADRELRSAGD